MAADLLFNQSPVGGSPTPLVFGDSDDGIVRDPVTVEAYALLGGVTVSAGVIYDNRVINWLDCRLVAQHQPAEPVAPQTSGGWGLSESMRAGTEVDWSTGLLHAAEPRAVHLVSLARRTEPATEWQTAARLAQLAGAAHQRGAERTVRSLAGWQLADRLAAVALSGMQAAVSHYTTRRASWQLARPRSKGWTAPMGASLRLHGVERTALPWQRGRVAPGGLSSLPPVVVPPQPSAWPPDLLFECPRVIGSPTLLLFGNLACWPDEPPATIYIPSARSYVTINSIELRRIDGNIALPARTFSMSLEAGSWTYGFNATLPAHTLANLEPASDGDPVEIEAKINGVPYRLSVLKYGSDDEFAKSTIRISGKGTAANLDAPYAPTRSFSNSTSLTAQQLMAEVLTVNGVGFGWSVDWGLVDWLVPAGAWAHQGTYISAINAIAAAAGGYVQPHPTLPVLRVLPLYPELPWHWSGVSPDIDLPADLVEVHGVEWINKPAYNRVYVSGVNRGVLGCGTRAGSAGDLVAPQVTDDLITDVDAARQRAAAVLSDTGRQANVSLRLPVLAGSGIIWPGKFVRRSAAAGNLMGLVRSTSVEYGFPKLRQTISLETHSA